MGFVHVPGYSRQIWKYDGGPFDECVRKFKKRRLSLMPARDLIEAELLCDKKHSILGRGELVAEACYYGTGGEVLLADGKYNMMLKHPQIATNAHKNKHEIVLDTKVWKELYRKAKRDVRKAMQTGILLLSLDDIQEDILLKNLHREKIPVFLYREHVKKYAEKIYDPYVKDVCNNILFQRFKPECELVSPIARPLEISNLSIDAWTGIGQMFELADLIYGAVGMSRLNANRSIR